MRARPSLPAAARAASALLAAVATLAVLGPTGAPPARADEAATPVTWTVVPSAGGSADGRVSLRHALDPGASASDEVLVSNLGERAATFAVYASDGVVTEDGTFDVSAPQDRPTDAGAWTTVGPAEGSRPREGGGILLDVPAGASAAVPVEIAVPADATPGDHPAGVVAELAYQSASAVQVASRVGVRIHLRVSGDLEPALVPRDVHARWVPSWNPFGRGTVHLEYTIANTGNVRLGAQAQATLAGPLGLGRTSVGAERREVLPRQETRVSVDLAAWPTVLSRGEVEVTPSVVGDDQVDAALSAASVRVTVWTLPWSQLALLAAVGGAVVLALWWRRRSAARIQARIDAAVAAAAGQRGGPEGTPEHADRLAQA